MQSGAGVLGALQKQLKATVSRPVQASRGDNTSGGTPQGQSPGTFSAYQQTTDLTGITDGRSRRWRQSYASSGAFCTLGSTKPSKKRNSAFGTTPAQYSTATSSGIARWSLKARSG